MRVWAMTDPALTLGAFLEWANEYREAIEEARWCQTHSNETNVTAALVAVDDLIRAEIGGG